MIDVEKIASLYETEYTFMALNATINNAMMFTKIHDDQSSKECMLVHDELLRRGYKLVNTKEEYETGVAKHGTPPAMVNKFAP